MVFSLGMAFPTNLIPFFEKLMPDMFDTIETLSWPKILTRTALSFFGSLKKEIADLSFSQGTKAMIFFFSLKYI